MSCQDTRWGSLTTLQRCSQCILQSQLTSQQDIRSGSLTSLLRCSQCILQSQSTEPEDPRWGSLTSLQRCSRCIQQNPYPPSGPEKSEFVLQSCYYLLLTTNTFRKAWTSFFPYYVWNIMTETKPFSRLASYPEYSLGILAFCRGLVIY